MSCDSYEILIKTETTDQCDTQFPVHDGKIMIIKELCVIFSQPSVLMRERTIEREASPPRVTTNSAYVVSNAIRDGITEGEGTVTHGGK